MANTQKYTDFLATLKEVAPDSYASMQQFWDTMAKNASASGLNKYKPKPSIDYLSPERLQQTASNMFMPNVMQAVSPQFQTGVNAMRGLQAKAGLMESPFALASEAGLRGQQASGASQEAMQRAIQLGQAQSSARVAGANVINQTQPQFGYQMLGQLKDALGTYSAYRGFQSQNQPSPYSLMPQRSGFQIPNAGQYMPTGR